MVVWGNTKDQFWQMLHYLNVSSTVTGKKMHVPAVCFPVRIQWEQGTDPEVNFVHIQTQ